MFTIKILHLFINNVNKDLIKLAAVLHESLDVFQAKSAESNTNNLMAIPSAITSINQSINPLKVQLINQGMYMFYTDDNKSV